MGVEKNISVVCITSSRVGLLEKSGINGEISDIEVYVTV